MITWAVLLPAVTVSEIQIAEDGRILTDAEVKTFINAARCACDSSFEVQFDVSTANEEGSLAVVRGKRCVDSDGRLSDSCDVLWRGDLFGLRTVEFEVAISEIADCDGESSTETLIVLADPNDEDFWQELATLELPVDTEPPPPPENAKTLGGEELAEVVFERPDAEERIKYQVLCARAGEPVFDDPPNAAFVSALDLCGAGSGVLSERFVCAEASGGTDSVTVLELSNGETYEFYVITIDAFGNASEVVEAGEATPAPELDLWELYKKNGGRADGGHCFVATAAFGDYDHPQVVVLREFRDRVLARSDLGRALIALYYRVSPPLAEWIARSDERRLAAQLLLRPITAIADMVTP